MLYNLLTKILLTLPEWECDGKEKTFSNTVAANLYFIKKWDFALLQGKILKVLNKNVKVFVKKNNLKVESSRLDVKGFTSIYLTSFVIGKNPFRVLISIYQS